MKRGKSRLVHYKELMPVPKIWGKRTECLKETLQRTRLDSLGEGVSRGLPGVETCLYAPGKHQDPNKELTKADDLAAATFLSAD